MCLKQLISHMQYLKMMVKEVVSKKKSLASPLFWSLCKVSACQFELFDTLNMCFDVAAV